MKTLIERLLAERSRVQVLSPAREPEAVPEVILAGVERALLEGETHYTSRPGLPELRETIARRLPDRDREEVVVCAGGSEALFTVLGALSPEPGSRFEVDPELEARALPLFELFGLRRRESEDEPAHIVYRRSTSTAGLLTENAEILDCGSRLEAPAGSSSEAVFVGDLDAIEGLESFRVGFVSARAPLVARVRSFKQALSICTAAPSQRAAVIALSRAGGGGGGGAS